MVLLATQKEFFLVSPGLIAQEEGRKIAVLGILKSGQTGHSWAKVVAQLLE